LNLEVDFDEYDSGFFHLAKNYILKKGNVLELHGAALKSKSKCKIESLLINELGNAKVDGKTEEVIVKKFQNLVDFDYRDFVMSKTLGMNINEYKDNKSISYRLAMKAQHYLNRKPEVGNTYYYVKSREDYELFETCDKSRIDLRYYNGIVKKILDVFKANYQTFESLSDFYGEESKEIDFDQENSGGVKLDSLSEYY